MTEYIDRTQESDDVFEREVLARVAAPTPPEVLREQVARELWTTGLQPSIYGRTPWEALGESTRDVYRRLADASLAVFRGQQDPAVQRVLALADELDGLVDDQTVDEVARVAHGWTLNRIRAALSVTP